METAVSILNKTRFSKRNLVLDCPIYIREHQLLVAITQVPGMDTPCILRAFSLPSGRVKWKVNLGSDRALDRLLAMPGGLVVGLGPIGLGVWDAGRGRSILKPQFRSHPNYNFSASAIAHGNDGRWFFAAYDVHDPQKETGTQHIVRFDSQTWAIDRQVKIRAPAAWLSCVAFPDGSTVAIGFEEGLVLLWDAIRNTKRELRGGGASQEVTRGITARMSIDFGNTNDACQLALDSRAERLAIGYRSGCVEIWDLERLTLAQTLAPEPSEPAPEGEVVCLSWVAQDRRLVTAARSGTIMQWDPLTGECMSRTGPSASEFDLDMVFVSDSLLLEIEDGDDFTATVRARDVGRPGIFESSQHRSREAHTCRLCGYYQPCSSLAADPPPPMRSWPEDSGVCCVGQQFPFVLSPGMSLKLVQASREACDDFE